MRLPFATKRYPRPNKHMRPKWVERTAARHALAVTLGDGMVIVSRKGQSGIERAERTARAWDLTIAEAEERHIKFWEDYDRGSR